jgi:hypothetical protein
MPALFQCSSIAMIFTLMSSRPSVADRMRYQRTMADRSGHDLTHRLLSQPYTIRSTTVE